MRMKAESQEEKIELSNVELSALVMDDIQGIFILFALFVLASFVTFLLEVLFWQGSPKVATSPGVKVAGPTLINTFFA